MLESKKTYSGRGPNKNSTISYRSRYPNDSVRIDEHRQRCNICLCFRETRPFQKFLFLLLRCTAGRTGYDQTEPTDARSGPSKDLNLWEGRIPWKTENTAERLASSPDG